MNEINNKENDDKDNDKVNRLGMESGRYYRLSHKLLEKVERQPEMFVGELKSY